MILPKPKDNEKRSRILFCVGPMFEDRLLLETAYTVEELIAAVNEFFDTHVIGEGDGYEAISLWNNPVPPNPQERFTFLKSRIVFCVVSEPPSGLVIAKETKSLMMKPA